MRREAPLDGLSENSSGGPLPRHRTIHGEIVAVLVDGVIFSTTPGDTARGAAETISYNVVLFGGGEHNYMERAQPYRRPFGNLRIISAGVGDPVSVILSTDYTDTTARLTLREDLDFHDCDLTPLIP